MNVDIKRVLEKQSYSIIGEHSAVKLCHWMKQSLLYNRECYKQLFYGIDSHRCLQMSPSITQCTQMCLFCWRVHQFTEEQNRHVDDPEFILDEAIRAQRKLITGFKGDPRCDHKKWLEANDPNMIACSLSGEPTMYPRLGEFLEVSHRRGFLTFLVTNGTRPEIIRDLDPLPKQLYVSVVAPNEEIHKRLCSPLIPNAWCNIKQTLEILPSLNTRTVIRHTLVNKWNMAKDTVPLYARLDEMAEPLFIEVKGYVFVGASRHRMTISNMPKHEQIKEFGENLAEEIGYKIAMEKPDSLVVLLTRDKSKIKIKN
ncbi:MAG: 4-demethylwyosine synthase TYW1 [Candidatus Thermoplasmatota archaeon]